MEKTVAETNQPKTRIVLAEDHSIVRLGLTRLLESEGFEVIAASEGAEAIKQVVKEHPDLIVLDCMMEGGVDGIRTCQMLKLIDAVSDIPVVMLTAYSYPALMKAAFKAGVERYLLKNQNPGELIRAVRDVLNWHRLVTRHRSIGDAAEMQRDIDFLIGEVKQLRKERFDLLSRLNEQENQSSKEHKGELPLTELSQLTAGLVHDMRNGLGIIRNTLGFMEDDLGGTHETDLLKISHSLDFCELVLRNLSALGGQDVFQACWVSLEAIVREVCFMLENKLVDVKLVVETDPDTPEILADEGQMKQVFMNLIKNAGEAMPDGGTLALRALREGDMLRVELSDTGCGISPENQARLFKEFFTTKERGYGLGLYIVHSIVKRHGGTIEVASELGKGTTFILRLPIESKQE